MRVLVPVFFSAPFGGLHSQVRSQCAAVVSQGWEAVVLCRPGPFADQLVADGVTVLRTDWTDLAVATADALAAGPFDLVHAHPFASREVGAAVAERLDVPLLVTFHGTYLDDVQQWHDRARLVLAVSDAVRDNLLARSPIRPDKVVVLPNGVDMGTFAAPAGGVGPVTPPLQVLVITRMEQDKQAVLRLVEDAWAAQAAEGRTDLTWRVAGDGSLRPRLEATAATLRGASGEPLVTFLGWLDGDALAQEYAAADLSVAPGRCTLESLSCGTPAIALGSRGYVGLMDEASLVRGAYANFGSVGVHPDQLEPGVLLADVARLAEDPGSLAGLGEVGREFVRVGFDQRHVDDVLLSLYRLYGSGKVRGGADGWALLSAVGWEAEHARWAVEDASTVTLDPQPDGSVLLASQVAPDGKCYVQLGPEPLAQPSAEAVTVRPGGRHRVVLEASDLSRTLSVQVWWLEYDAEQRTSHVVHRLRPGRNEIVQTVSPDTTTGRLALRVSGPGSVRLSPPAVEAAEPG